MSVPLAPGGVTAALLGPLLGVDPHQPRLIWHGTGRTELSTATLANWSAKTAGLLVDELGTQPGQVAAVSHGCPTSLFRGVRILNTTDEAGH